MKKNVKQLKHDIQGLGQRFQLDGDFLEGISREAFRIAHDVSSYSFAALANAALHGNTLHVFLAEGARHGVAITRAVSRRPRTYGNTSPVSSYDR